MDAQTEFVSSEFRKFSKEWDFEQRTSSPGNSKGNGKVESAVKTAKNLIRKALDAGTDPYLAILDYRNTPTQGMESSPVQRLMNRRTRTLLPMTKALLESRTPHPDQEIKELSKRQQQQSKYYNRSTRTVLPRNNLSKTASSPRVFCVWLASGLRPLCVHGCPRVRPLCGHSASSLRAQCVQSAGIVRPFCGHRASTLRLCICGQVERYAVNL